LEHQLVYHDKFLTISESYITHGILHGITPLRPQPRTTPAHLYRFQGHIRGQIVATSPSLPGIWQNRSSHRDLSFWRPWAEGIPLRLMPQIYRYEHLRDIGRYFENRIRGYSQYSLLRAPSIWRKLAETKSYAEVPPGQDVQQYPALQVCDQKTSGSASVNEGSMGPEKVSS